MPNSLTPTQLRDLARIGAKARLEEIRTEIAVIQALLAEAPSGNRRTQKTARAAKGVVARKRGKLSAQGRANIIAAQKARWAKLKSEKASTAAAEDTAPATKSRRSRKHAAAKK